MWEEIWGSRSLNLSNRSNTCRGSAGEQGRIDLDQLFLWCLSLSLSLCLLGDKHSSARTDKANYGVHCNFMTKCYKKLLSDVWLSMSSLHQYYSRFLILNKYYCFLPCHRLVSEGTGEGATWPKVKQDHSARIERRKTQFMKPSWQPIKDLGQLFTRWPRSMWRDWEWDINHARGRCSCCLCLHVVKTLRFLP